MKTLYLFLLIIAFDSCNQNPKSETTEQQPENLADKYLGYWQRDDKSQEVLRILENNTSYYISDGEKEIPIQYDSKENKFKIHRSDQDIEIVYSEPDKQLHWIVIAFGEATGQIVWKYNFLKK